MPMCSRYGQLRFSLPGHLGSEIVRLRSGQLRRFFYAVFPPVHGGKADVRFPARSSWIVDNWFRISFTISGKILSICRHHFFLCEQPVLTAFNYECGTKAYASVNANTFLIR